MVGGKQIAKTGLLNRGCDTRLCEIVDHVHDYG